MRILNGRVLGDAFGKYTCFTPQGCSVVDYVIVSEGILDQILYFCINDFVATISDCHCLLEWELSSRYQNNCAFNDVELYDKSPNYIWSDESAVKFQSALLSPEIQAKIENFNKCFIDGSQYSVDSASMELSNIMLNAAEKCLKRNPYKSSKNKRKKNWFDEDLQKCRNRLINYGTIYSKYPHDPLVRGHYYKLNKEYSRLRKYKYKSYQKHLLD